MPAGGAQMMRHILAGAALALSGAQLSAAPAGQFVVVAAPRHPAVTNMQAAYRPNDPQLIDRLVSFDGAGLSFDGDYKDCAQATSTTTKLAAGALMRRIFPDRPNYGKRSVASPADFGLKIAPATMVNATSYRCVTPRGNHGAEWTGATMFAIGDGRWALSLIRDHLLILKPVSGPIQASFSCVKASSVIDRTICGDRLLAGWDRSVATAYRQGNGGLEDQRAWLAERDKCGADKACLHESMSLRVNNLLR